MRVSAGSPTSRGETSSTLASSGRFNPPKGAAARSTSSSFTTPSSRLGAPTGSIASDALGALSAGDLPGISMVLIDGRITIGRSRNTPPAARAAEVVKGHEPAGAGH